MCGWLSVCERQILCDHRRAHISSRTTSFIFHVRPLWDAPFSAFFSRPPSTRRLSLFFVILLNCFVRRFREINYYLPGLICYFWTFRRHLNIWTFRHPLYVYRPLKSHFDWILRDFCFLARETLCNVINPPETSRGSQSREEKNHTKFSFDIRRQHVTITRFDEI